jgi:hypothetical protein
MNRKSKIKAGDLLVTIDDVIIPVSMIFKKSDYLHSKTIGAYKICLVLDGKIDTRVGDFYADVVYVLSEGNTGYIQASDLRKL